VSGASQVQAMPIVNTTQDQSTHDNANTTIMITSPDRNSQTECSLILPSTTNSAVTIDDNVKLVPKKEEIPVAMEEVAATTPIEITSKDQFVSLLIKYY
jgi:hypothetical protein